MDVYSTGALLQVVENLDIQTPYFLNTLFLDEIQSEDEQILFDVKDGKRRIAPLILPIMEGKVVQELGYKTETLTPPYIKLKTPILPAKQLKRRAGEAIGGNLTPDQRRQAAIGEALADHETMILQREEVMASEVLRLGTLTLTIEGLGDVVLDFGRAAALTVALLGAAKWSAATGTPVTDIETWAGLIQANGGGVVRRVTMAPDAWQNARQRTEVKDLLDTRRGSASTAELGPQVAEKARYIGTLGQFEIWVYDDIYINEAGVATHVMPTGSVVMAGPDALCTRCYGAIQDVRALRALRRFIKMWEEQDPSAEITMTQSAPLMVPFRPNGTLGATVL